MDTSDAVQQRAEGHGGAPPTRYERGERERGEGEAVRRVARLGDVPYPWRDQQHREEVRERFERKEERGGRRAVAKDLGEVHAEGRIEAAARSWRRGEADSARAFARLCTSGAGASTVNAIVASPLSSTSAAVR
jgi:hypothetical protein